MVPPLFSFILLNSFLQGSIANFPCTKMWSRVPALVGTRAANVYKHSYRRRLVSTAVPAAVPPSGDDLPTTPIDFYTSAKIEGEESNSAIITLRPGERLRAEAGAMLFMTEGVHMDTKLAGASSAFTRFLTGQSTFLLLFSQ
jgi:hypothetical protein